MTSQEEGQKLKERTRRIWEQRRARWEAWKREQRIIAAQKQKEK